MQTFAIRQGAYDNYYNISLIGQISRVNENNGINPLWSKKELEQIYNEISISVDAGMWLPMFEKMKEDFEKKNDLEIVEIDKYNAKWRGKEKQGWSDWFIFKASNTSTMLSTETSSIYSFAGPGKVTWIDLALVKIEELNSLNARIIVRAFKNEDNITKYQPLLGDA